MKMSILLSTIIASNLIFSGCTKYISTKAPRLQYVDCNDSFNGEFKTNGKYVLIDKSKFKIMAKKCNKIKKQCEFMRDEIKEYNKNFSKGE